MTRLFISDASLIVHLVFLAFYFTFLPLSPFLPYPFYSLCTYSPHNLNLGGRLLFAVSCLSIPYTYHSLSTLSILACSCLSHLVPSRISISIRGIDPLHHHSFIGLVPIPPLTPNSPRRLLIIRSGCHTVYIHLPLPHVHPISTATLILSRLQPRLDIWTRCQWTLKMKGSSDTRLHP